MKARLLLPILSFSGGLLSAAEPTPVRTTHPVPAEAVNALRATGRTAPAEQAYLFSRATGIIVERPVDIGDRVKAGDLLARIEAPEVTHQIAAANARVEQTTARAELAAALLKRSESLAETNAVSRETLDERRAATKTALADQLAAEAELKTLQETEGFLTIRAPFDGTITARRIDRGDHVNGDPSSSEAWLFHIARLNELRMVLHMPPADALQVHRDQEAEVEFPDIPGKTFTGTVARSSSLIDPRSGTMQVELTLPNTDFILPAGLSGSARIKNETVSSTLLVPSNSITTRDGLPHLAVTEDGKVRFIGVGTGRTLGNRVEILSGLTTGQEVIISPNSLLRDGDPVAANPLSTAKAGS